MPFFTVIVPVHNAADCVLTAIESVLAQTDRDFELIVVDDGSTDGTARLLETVADPRARTLRQPASGTPAGARNAGIREAAGTFLAFLDADDSWDAPKLEMVRRRLEADPGLDLVCHGVRLVTKGRILGKRAYALASAGSFYEQLLYRGNFLTTSATVVRTARARDLGGFDESGELRIGEDLDFWLRLAASGARPCLLPDLLGSYEVGRGVSADPSGAFEKTFRILDRHYERLAGEGRLRLGRAIWRRVRARLALARESVRRRRYARALDSLLRLPSDVVTRYVHYAKLKDHRE